MNSINPPEKLTVALLIKELSRVPLHSTVLLEESPLLEICFRQGDSPENDVLTIRPFGATLLQHSIELAAQEDENNRHSQEDTQAENGEDETGEIGEEGSEE